MNLIALFFLPFLFNPSFWERASEHLWLVIALVLVQTGYATSTLILTNNHHFQIAYPLSRTGPIVILIGEIIFLHETFTPLQITGVTLVGIGALLIGFDKRLFGVRTKFFLLLLPVLFLLAAAMLLSKVGVEYFSPAELWSLSLFQLPFLTAVIFSLGLGGLIPLELRNQKLIILSAIAMVLTFYLALIALMTLPAAVVSAGRSFSIVIGVFLGGKMFDEGHHAKHYFAALLIILGITLSLSGEFGHNDA